MRASWLFALAALAPLTGPAAVPVGPPDAFPLGGVARIELPAPDVEAALAADAARRRQPVPRRVAVPLPFEADTSDAGTWEKTDDGGSLWRLRLASPGAVFLSVKLSELDLPEGAVLRLYPAAPDAETRPAARDFVAGPYTARHTRGERRFGSPMIPGDETVVELRLPPGSPDPVLRIESVSHGFRDPLGFRSSPAFPGGDFSCQRDVNCPEGAAYQDDKRAVAEGYDGAFVCSGTMLENTAMDNRYLYLTADHCEFWIDPPTLSFYWNYENSGCGTDDAPLSFSTGAVTRFRSAAADIHLLELQGTDIDDTFDIWFAGWSRATTPPASAGNIGFPDDKPKKIALRNTPVTDCAPSGCPGGWGPDYWRITAYDVGVTEGGSSGSALLDENHRVVGTLTGGIGTDCNDFAWDEYAKIHPVWAGLAPYLDPLGTGVIAVDGRDHADLPPAPPAADGVTGTGIRLGRGVLSTLTVSYDAATCSADHAVMLWGNLGDFGGYQGSVGPDCNVGSGGSKDFTFPATNVWFNLVWVNASDVAGHPGFASAWPRDWSAAGLCGVDSDDFSDATCD